MSFGDDLLVVIRRCVPIFLRLTLGRDVFDRGRRSLRALWAIRHAERRLGRFRALRPVHGTAKPVGTSRSSPNPGLGGHSRRAGPWRGASPRAVYQVVRTLERDPTAPVCLRDEHGNRD
jgi:hypothetical protein